MEYMEKYPYRLNIRMDEMMRDEVQKRALQLNVSSAALIRLLIKKQIQNLKSDDFY
jgi:hypothetical protein